MSLTDKFNYKRIVLNLSSITTFFFDLYCFELTTFFSFHVSKFVLLKAYTLFLIEVLGIGRNDTI